MKRGTADDTTDDGSNSTASTDAEAGDAEAATPGRGRGTGGTSDPSVASLPGFDDGGGRSDPSVARLPADARSAVAVQRSSEEREYPAGYDPDFDSPEESPSEQLEQYRGWNSPETSTTEDLTGDSLDDVDPTDWDQVEGLTREEFEEMDEEAVREAAMTMLGKHEDVEDIFGKRIELFGKDRLSGGDYLARSVDAAFKSSLSGAAIGGVGGGPIGALAGAGKGALIGLLTGPVKAEVKHHADKQYDRDYHELGITEKAKAYAGAARDTFGGLFGGSGGDPEGEEVSLDEFEGGEDELGDHAERVRELRSMDQGDFAGLSPEEQRRYIESLQKMDLMSSVLMGTMGEVDQETVNVLKLKQRLGEGGFAAVFAALKESGIEGAKDLAGEGLDPSSIGPEVAEKGLASLLVGPSVDTVKDVAKERYDVDGEAKLESLGDEHIEPLIRELEEDGDDAG